MKTIDAWVPILTSGTFISMEGRRITVTDADVMDYVRNTSTSLVGGHTLPITLGHPNDTAAPAVGWWDGIRYDDGLAQAHVKDMDAGLLAKIRAKAYQYVSPVLLPGQKQILNFGILGAAPPAISALPALSLSTGSAQVALYVPICFSTGESDMLTSLFDLFGMIGKIFRRQREDTIAARGLDAADTIFPEWQLQIMEQVTSPSTSLTTGNSGNQDIKSLQQPSEANTPSLSGNPPQDHGDNKEVYMDEKEVQALRERNAKLEAEAKARAEADLQSAKSGIASFCADLQRQGKILPHEGAALAETMLVLHSDSTMVSLAAGSPQVEKMDFLKQLLQQLPARVPMKFAAPKKTASPAGMKSGKLPGIYDFTAHGVTVDPERLAVDARAAELVAFGMPYESAVAFAMKEVDNGAQ